LDKRAKLQELEARFKLADKNGVGRSKLEEAEIGMPRGPKAFDEIKTRKKGCVTLEQLQSWMRQPHSTAD